MTIDKTNIIQYFEEDLEDSLPLMEFTEAEKEDITTAKISMKKNMAEDNIREQTIIIQQYLDNYQHQYGSTPELLVLQGRINQIRIIFNLIDGDNEL